MKSIILSSLFVLGLFGAEALAQQPSNTDMADLQMKTHLAVYHKYFKALRAKVLLNKCGGNSTTALDAMINTATTYATGFAFSAMEEREAFSNMTLEGRSAIAHEIAVGVYGFLVGYDMGYSDATRAAFAYRIKGEPNSFEDISCDMVDEFALSALNESEE